MKRLLSLLLPLALLGCSERAPYEERLLVFGTLVDLTFHGVEAEQGAQAAAAVEQRLQALHRQLHPTEGDGGLAQANRLLSRGEPARASDELAGLLRQAQGLAHSSGYRFDPGVGALTRLWGFSAEEPPTRPPGDAELLAWQADPPSVADLRIQGQRLSSPRRDLQLDLGAFAKGYAVEQGVQVARQQAVPAGIVNAGGDLCTFGRPGDRLWRIGVRHPRDAGVLAAIAVDGGECVFTSGDYERYFEHQGTRYHHILDPATGQPARGVTSVTVVAADGEVADAAATALFVAGVDDWHRVAKQLHVRYVMLVDAEGRVHMNPAMAKRVEFTGEQPEVVLSPPL